MFLSVAEGWNTLPFHDTVDFQVVREWAAQSLTSDNYDDILRRYALEHARWLQDYEEYDAEKRINPNAKHPFHPPWSSSWWKPAKFYEDTLLISGLTLAKETAEKMRRDPLFNLKLFQKLVKMSGNTYQGDTTTLNFLAGDGPESSLNPIQQLDMGFIVFSDDHILCDIVRPNASQFMLLHNIGNFHWRLVGYDISPDHTRCNIKSIFYREKNAEEDPDYPTVPEVLFDLFRSHCIQSKKEEENFDPDHILVDPKLIEKAKEKPWLEHMKDLKKLNAQKHHFSDLHALAERVKQYESRIEENKSKDDDEQSIYEDAVAAFFEIQDYLRANAPEEELLFPTLITEHSYRDDGDYDYDKEEKMYFRKPYIRDIELPEFKEKIEARNQKIMQDVDTSDLDKEIALLQPKQRQIEAYFFDIDDRLRDQSIDEQKRIISEELKKVEHSEEIYDIRMHKYKVLQGMLENLQKKKGFINL